MTIVDEFHRDAERVLDRLVDGELGLHERRELLAALDDEPGGWRRCALAFLEAQAWRWQLSRAATEPILAQVSSPQRKSAARRGMLWGGLFAVAASLLVAFALGTRFPTGDPAVEALADHQPDTSATPDGPTLPDRQQPQEVVRPEPQPEPNQLAGGDDVGGDTPLELPWETVTLTPLGAQRSADPIQLRVAKEGGQADRALGGLPAALSRSFEQQGWQVNRRQGLLPIDLSDGRRLEVPVEEVDLHNPVAVQF